MALSVYELDSSPGVQKNAAATRVDRGGGDGGRVRPRVWAFRQGAAVSTAPAGGETASPRLACVNGKM
jgi:hypothetical protein